MTQILGLVFLGLNANFLGNLKKNEKLLQKGNLEKLMKKPWKWKLPISIFTEMWGTASAASIAMQIRIARPPATNCGNRLRSDVKEETRRGITHQLLE